MSYSQFDRFRPVPAAPVKSSLNTVVIPAGGPGTAAFASSTNVTEAPTAARTATTAKLLLLMGRAFRGWNCGGRRVGRALSQKLTAAYSRLSICSHAAVRRALGDSTKQYSSPILELWLAQNRAKGR